MNIEIKDIRYLGTDGKLHTVKGHLLETATTNFVKSPTMLSKPVKQFSLNNKLLATYPSISNAVEATGFNINNLVNAIKKHKVYKNFIWSFINEEDY